MVRRGTLKDRRSRRASYSDCTESCRAGEKIRGLEIAGQKALRPGWQAPRWSPGFSLEGALTRLKPGLQLNVVIRPAVAAFVHVLNLFLQLRPGQHAPP